MPIVSAAPVFRTSSPVATANRPSPARKSPLLSSARSTPSSDSATPTPARSRNQLPPRYPATAVTRPATKSTPLTTSALAATIAPRRGTAVMLARIIPVPYSLVTTNVPSASAVSWEKIRPQVRNEPAASPVSPAAIASAAAQQTSVVSPAPSRNSSASDQRVDRTL